MVTSYYTDVVFKICCSQEALNIVQVHIAMRNIPELKK